MLRTFRGDMKMALNRRRAVLLAIALGCGASTVNAQAVPQDIQKAAEDKAVNLCSTCHGPRGISTSAEFPILAAQRKGYLEAQIDAFRKKTRAERDAHDFMWGIAGNLDQAIIGGIANYYSTQPAARGRIDDPALVAQGKELYDKGVSDRGIPACATCHGANGRRRRRIFRASRDNIRNTSQSNSTTSNRWFEPRR